MPPPAHAAQRALPHPTWDILWHHQCHLFQFSLMVVIFTWPLNLLSVILPNWVMAMGTVKEKEDGGEVHYERGYISYGIWKLCVDGGECFDPHDVQSDVGVGAWLYSVKVFVVLSALLHGVATLCGVLQNFLPRDVSRHWHPFLKRALHRKCCYTEDISFVGGFLGVLSVIIVMLGTQRVISDGGTYSYSFALGFFASSLTLICSIALAKSRNTSRPRPRHRRSGRQRGGDVTETQQSPAGTGQDDIVIVAVASQEQLTAAELQSQASCSGSSIGGGATASASASASASPTAARINSASMMELGDLTSLGELADTESASLKVQLGAPQTPSTGADNPGDLRDLAATATATGGGGAAAESSTELRPLSAKKKNSARDKNAVTGDPHDFSTGKKRSEGQKDEEEDAVEERGYSAAACWRKEPRDSERGLYCLGVRPGGLLLPYDDDDSVYRYHGNPKRIVRSDPAYYYYTEREHDAYRNDPELDEFARAARRNGRERPDCHRPGHTDFAGASAKRTDHRGRGGTACDALDKHASYDRCSVHRHQLHYHQQQRNTAAPETRKSQSDGGPTCREKRTDGAAASAYWRGCDSRDSAHDAAVTDAQCLEEGEEARQAERRTRWYERSTSRSRSRSRERHRRQNSNDGGGGSGGSRPKRGMHADTDVLSHPSDRPPSATTPPSSSFVSITTSLPHPPGRLYRTSPLIRSLEMENIPAMFSDDAPESLPAGGASASSACDGVSSSRPKSSRTSLSGRKTPPLLAKSVEMKNKPAVYSQPPVRGGGDEVNDPQARSPLGRISRSEPVDRSVEIEDVRLTLSGSDDSQASPADKASSVPQKYDRSSSCEQKHYL